MSRLKSTTLSLTLGLFLLAATSTQLGACAVTDNNPPECPVGNASWICSGWVCPAST